MSEIYIDRDAGQAGVDDAKLRAIADAVQVHVRNGDLPALQVAVAREGRVLLHVTAGRVVAGGREQAATNRTLFVGYSCTKAVTSSAAWLLFQDGLLTPATHVAELVPEFAGEGKDAVTVAHLLTHLAGFPQAPFDPLDWPNPTARRARFERWRLDYEPGSTFHYHAQSAMWVLAEVMERATGEPFADFVRRRVVGPLGLEDFAYGATGPENARIADVVHVGEEPAGGDPLGGGLIFDGDRSGYEAYLSRYNTPEYRAICPPSTGLACSAGALTLFYQGLLRGGPLNAPWSVWRPGTLEDALTVFTGDLVDPITNQIANRALGVVIAGDDMRMFRAFAPGNSPRAFGHAGVGGQFSWADPASGLSFALLTNGLERNTAKLGLRGMMIASMAADCLSS